jgi:hypothetical protein
MWEIFAKEPGMLVVVVLAVCGTLIAVTAILACQWRAVRESELEGNLKQDMLNRGMAVDDIERLIKATSRPPAPEEKPDLISDNEKELIESLVDEGKSAEEIERIIRAVKTPVAPPAAEENPTANARV